MLIAGWVRKIELPAEVIFPVSTTIVKTLRENNQSKKSPMVKGFNKAG